MYKKLLFVKQHGLLFGILLAFIILGIIYAFLSRVPYTDDAFVIANIRPVSSRVAGFVNKIDVEKNQTVTKGQKLFSLDARPYQLALEDAKANLEKGKAQVAALSTKLEADNELVNEKKLSYQTAQFNMQNAQELAKKKFFSEAETKNMGRSTNIAYAAYQAAILQLKVDEKYYQQAQFNLKQLQVQVAEKELNLSYTIVYALENGTVSNLNLSEGTFVSPGKPLFAFVNTDNWWVQANIKETELSKVKEGDKASIYLKIYPDHEFKGTVANIAWAVERQNSDPRTYLQRVQNENEWFLLPQRFPVLIKIDNVDLKKYPLHVGASAHVRIYTK